MSKKKTLTIILALGGICIISFCIINYSISAKFKEGIKVMSYIPPNIVGESGYQIDKYENIENNEWLNENEVLSLTKKGELKNSDSTTSIRYCSIYNLNTNETKEFRDVNIGGFLGLSPDKKYVLYSEPKVIPESGSEEWKKEYESEQLFHYKFKVLNLITKEITDINTEKKRNDDVEFKWVGNNKILQSYNHEAWKITDISGKVFVNGNYGDNCMSYPDIVDKENIKDLGDSIEGKFYYKQNMKGKDGKKISTQICSLDVKTKEIKVLWENKKSFNAYKKGNTILIDMYNYIIIMDEFGNKIRNIDVPKGVQISQYKLSPDGSKAAYQEFSDNDHSEEFLKVMDLKTGEIKEIVKSSIFQDENEEGKITTLTIRDGVKIQVEKQIDNICWSSNGKSLSFTYGNSQLNDPKINTYIVSFER